MKKGELLRTGIVLLSVGLAACGGSGAGVPGDDEPTPDGPPTAVGSGSLLILQETLFGNSFTIEGGSFSAASRPTTNERVDGPCRIRTGAASSGAKVGAGTITITGGVDVVTMTPEPDNDYFAMQSGLHFAGGASLAIAATGDVVPAFTDSITFPNPVSVTTPSSPFFTMSKSGFSAAWSGSGAVIVQIGQSPVVVISCRFDGVTTATIPASALSDLVVGEDDTTVIIGTSNKESIDASGFAVDVEAINAGFVGMTTVQP